MAYLALNLLAGVGWGIYWFGTRSRLAYPEYMAAQARAYVLAFALLVPPGMAYMTVLPGTDDFLEIPVQAVMLIALVMCPAVAWCGGKKAIRRNASTGKSEREAGDRGRAGTTSLLALAGVSITVSFCVSLGVWLLVKVLFADAIT